MSVTQASATPNAIKARHACRPGGVAERGSRGSENKARRQRPLGLPPPE